jgi:hypothetical protein
MALRDQAQRCRAPVCGGAQSVTLLFKLDARVRQQQPDGLPLRARRGAAAEASEVRLHAVQSQSHWSQRRTARVARRAAAHQAANCPVSEDWLGHGRRRKAAARAEVARRRASSFFFSAQPPRGDQKSASATRVLPYLVARRDARAERGWRRRRECARDARRALRRAAAAAAAAPRSSVSPRRRAAARHTMRCYAPSAAARAPARARRRARRTRAAAALRGAARRRLLQRAGRALVRRGDVLQPLRRGAPASAAALRSALRASACKRTTRDASCACSR